MIRQILVNLLGNALKFTDKGELVIKVHLASSDTVLRTCQIEFSVADTGIGIPEWALENLFTPFTQVESPTNRRYGGTGLGLTICKLLTEIMGGGISVESTVGKGTTFSFNISLKISDDSALSNESEGEALKDGRSDDQTTGQQHALSSCEGLSSISESHSSRILVAEDNLVNQRVVLMILKRLGYTEVVTVADGEQAVAAVRESAYDLVLMDVSMPRMDGITATKQIRELDRVLSRQTHVIGLSARAMEEDREEAKLAGMDGYLSKPVKLEEIDFVLRHYLDPKREAGGPLEGAQLSKNIF